jgi:hypothetical protein
MLLLDGVGCRENDKDGSLITQTYKALFDDSLLSFWAYFEAIELLLHAGLDCLDWKSTTPVVFRVYNTTLSSALCLFRRR